LNKKLATSFQDDTFSIRLAYQKFVLAENDLANIMGQFGNPFG